MAGSTGANMAAQRQVDRSRSRYLGQERVRRQRRERDSAAKAQSTADLLVGAADKDRVGEQALHRAYAAPAPQTNLGAGTSGAVQLAPMAGAQTVEALANERGKAKSYVADAAATRAALDTFGDVMGSAQIQAQRNAQDIGENNLAISNWNQYVLPAQMARAANAGRGWATAADLLQFAAALYAPTALAKKAPETAATQALGGGGPGYFDPSIYNAAPRAGAGFYPGPY